MNQHEEAIGLLRRAGEREDDGIDLAETALALAALDQPQVELRPYREHLEVLAAQARAEGAALRLDDRLRLLRRVLVVQHRYHGDEAHYDDPANANLMQVIERRRGLPVALGIIYLHVAEALGWRMTGLNFPGHFFLRLDALDGCAILDPFRAGQTCRPEDLRDFLPPAAGDDEDAEDDGVHPDFTEPVSKRDVLLRLQNNVKRRHLDADRLDAAVDTLQTMVLIAPRRPALWREMSALQVERGNLRAAITALDVVTSLGGDADHLQRTAAMTQRLKRQLN